MTIDLGDLSFDHVVYDAEADVLYLSAGEPREAADSVATPEGHAIRYDERGKIIGVTIVNAKWLIDRDGELEISVRVRGDDLAPALAGT